MPSSRRVSERLRQPSGRDGYELGHLQLCHLFEDSSHHATPKKLLSAMTGSFPGWHKSPLHKQSSRMTTTPQLHPKSGGRAICFGLAENCWGRGGSNSSVCAHPFRFNVHVIDRVIMVGLVYLGCIVGGEAALFMR